MADQSASGEWTGYYNYGDSLPPHMMDLRLHFHAGSLTGHGMDDIGKFTVGGTFGSTDCSWTKTYLFHTIAYVGFIEEGRIWGTWSGGSNKGGFMIWQRPSEALGIEDASTFCIADALHRMADRPIKERSRTGR